ncbi:transglutaminase domain-containing protein [bacterium]|nr:transglutaminase domain-containing protein [bacterium]
MSDKNKKTDVSVIINIIFVSLFIAVCVFVYSFISKDNFAVLKKTAQQTYKDKEQQQLQLPEKTKEETVVELPPFKKYKFKYTYDVEIFGSIKDMEVQILVPSDEKEKQYVSDFSISVPPQKMYNNGTTNIAEYKLENLENQHIVFVLEGDANVRTYTLDTAKKLNKNLTPEKDLSRYLQPELYIESNDSVIKSAAKRIKGSTKEEIVQNIYEYLQKNIAYVAIPGTLGAKKTLEVKQGKCSEFSAAMVALCRAKNIPARLVIGNIARKEIPQHGWVEVYYDEYGWVAYDPTKKATIVKIVDNNGNVIKEEKRYDTNSHVNYIASGRNEWNMFKMHYTTNPSRNGTARVSEKIEIEEM